MPSVQEAGGKWEEASLPETLESLDRMLPTTSMTEVFPAAGPRAAATQSPKLVPLSLLAMSFGG